MKERYLAGVDIGGTSTTVGLIHPEGRVLDRSIIQLYEFKDQSCRSFLDQIVRDVNELVDKHGVELAGVGIGAPNGNYYRGTIEYAPNLPWKGVHQLTDYLSEKLICPVVLTNDANAAAIGEKQFGVARDLDDFILITLGTGLGSGIFVQGKILYGHDGFAGELGHAILMPGGRTCTCGRRGCLEAYVSIRGIIQTYEELGGDTNKSPKELAEMARNGDKRSLDTFLQTGVWLGLKLADAAAYTSPEAIIFFGGIAQAHDLFMPATRETLEANVHNLYKGKINLMISGLELNDAAVLGAAGLVQRVVPL